MIETCVETERQYCRGNGVCCSCSVVLTQVQGGVRRSEEVDREIGSDKLEGRVMEGK